jgi:hypothetical protein
MSEYNYGAYSSPSKMEVKSAFPLRKPASVISAPSLPLKQSKPLKPINFDPNPKSRDPLKWNFNRGLLSHTVDDKPYARPQQYKSQRALSDFGRAKSGVYPYATHGKFMTVYYTSIYLFL